MTDREKLIREAVDATLQGERHRALQIYTRLLMRDRGDAEAREGLRRLGVPVPSELDPGADPSQGILGPAERPGGLRFPWMSATGEPAAGPKPNAERQAAGTPPVYNISQRPDYKSKAERDRLALLLGLLAILAVLISLMIPGCGRLFVPLSTFTAPATATVTPVRESSRAPPGSEIPPAALPPALLSGGAREKTPSGDRWSLDPPYSQSEAYRATVATDVLRADPTLDQAQVGSVAAARTEGGIKLTGTDAARLTEENWRTLASAVWRYTEKKGEYPDRLADLVPGFLDSLPLEAVTGKAGERAMPTGQGGWVYRPPVGSGNLWAGVAAAVTPDLLPGKLEPLGQFTPITVKAHKGSGTLEVWSGEKRLRSYPMGVGANNLTPEGTFTIDYRATISENLPDGRPNPFGTRWLRLTVEAEAGSFGIHGSDDPKSVLEPLSLGCLRLRRGDLEDFYRMVPTGTPVSIDNR